MFRNCQTQDNGWESSFACLDSSLPLFLLNFDGKAKKSSNKLNWEMANTNFVAAFEIEKSFNGIDFELLANIDKQDVNDGKRNFTYEDENPYSITYYRLKIIEQNGNFSYSKTISILNSDTKLAITKIYPNPAHNNLTIDYNIETGITDDMVFYIYNLDGKLMQMKKVHANNKTQGSQKLNLSMLPSGKYFLKVKNGGYQTTLGFIKTK